MDLSSQTFGYAADPKDIKDSDFLAEALPKLVTPSKVLRLRDFATSSNQGSLPSCVGNSTADAMEILSAAQGFPKVELSRLFVWTMARSLMAEKGYKEKTGTYIRLAFAALEKFGICLEKDWPYVEANWNKQPSFAAMRAGTARKVKKSYKITQTGTARLNAIKAALKANHPVVFGTQISKDWYSYKAGTVLQIPTAPIGGHAIVITGYDTAKDAFEVKNSWGSGWGDGGFCLLASKYIAWSGTDDLWVPTMGNSFK